MLCTSVFKTSPQGYIFLLTAGIVLCQVLDVRRKQLDDKMEENKRRQEESIESREQLLRELEEAQRMTAREKSEEARLRREREEEIQAQVEI